MKKTKLKTGLILVHKKQENGSILITLKKTK